MLTVKVPSNSADQQSSPIQPDQTGGAAFDGEQAARTAQVNEAWVKNAQAGWMDGMNTLLYHPDTGFLNQRGGLAVGGYGGLQDAIGNLCRQTADNLADDTQRGIFERSTAPLLGALQAQIRQHADNQCRVFDQEASHNRLQNSSNLAVNGYDPAPGVDNMVYRFGAATAHNELENSFRHAHGDPAEEHNQPLWEHYLQFGPDGNGGMCAIHTGIVNRLLQNNQPDDARAYLTGIQHTLPAPTRDKLDQFISTGVDRQQALNAVLQAQAKSEEPAEQQKSLDDMRDGGKLNDSAHAIASHSLQAAQQQKLAVQKQNDEQSLTQVWDLKRANAHAALTDIPASTLAYLKSRGLDKNAEAILSSHPASDDPALFNQLHRLASEDPVKFAQTSLITSSGHLSRAHMDYLQSVQDAINKQDPQLMQASKAVNDGVNTMQAEMKLAGINPARGSAEEKQQAQLESDLRDQIIAAQQAKNGTPLTREEVQNLATGYFADHVLNNGKQGGEEEVRKPVTAQPGKQPLTAGTNNSQRRERLDIDKEITQKRFKNLEHGSLSDVNAIVLHRTDTDTGRGVLNTYGAGQKTGAHFLVDETGKIYQTADLTKRAWHVGNIRRKCEDEGTCTDEDAAEARRILAQKDKGLHGKLIDQTNSEVNTKNYPERYPYNGDSVGIEVVGRFDGKTRQFVPPTEAQLNSVHQLVASLQKKYGLTNDDVYTHGGISYKQESEGQGLGYEE